MKNVLFAVILIGMCFFMLACNSSKEIIPETETPQIFPILPNDIIGDYRTIKDTNAYCQMTIRASPDSAYDFVAYYFPNLWPWPYYKGKIINNELDIALQEFDGNIPSQGGNPRPYHQNFKATGKISFENNLQVITWDIDSEQTGFMADKFNDTLRTYLCK